MHTRSTSNPEKPVSTEPEGSGPGRLYAYLLSHVIFFGAVSLLPHFLTGADGEVTFGLLTASLVTAPTILGGCTMVHAFLKQTVFFKTRKLPPR